MKTCDYCKRAATTEIVAYWSSFFACAEHDEEMAADCVNNDVSIIDIRKVK